MTINVTQDDIDNGQRGRALSCPIARALERATGQDWWVGDGCDGGTVLVPALNEPDEQSPGSVTRWRRRFDRMLPVKPFSFELYD